MSCFELMAGIAFVAGFLLLELFRLIAERRKNEYFLKITKTFQVLICGYGSIYFVYHGVEMAMMSPGFSALNFAVAAIIAFYAYIVIWSR